MTPKLEFLARLVASVDAPRPVAKTFAGTREMIVITGGTVEGRIAGRIMPGGVDWCLNHDGGLATVWARYAIERDDGSLIMVTNEGTVREMPDGSWQGHTVPKLEAGADDLRWLATTVLVGTLHARADGTAVELNFYAVT